MPENIDAIQTKRAQVAANISYLEGQIGQLQQQRQQIDAQLQVHGNNLLASRGALIAFDEVLQLVLPPVPEGTPPAPAPLTIVPDEATAPTPN